MKHTIIHTSRREERSLKRPTRINEKSRPNVGLFKERKNRSNDTKSRTLSGLNGNKSVVEK